MFKAAIRVNKLTSIAQLRGQSLHAQRHDETGKMRVREDAEPGAGLAWSKLDGNDRDYLAAFKVHKSETGAGERKGAPLALQAICVVSPEWVEKAGDLHDPDNPHNRQLFNQAKAWAESWAGDGAVFASRLDLDERGGAVVDLMISPVRESRGKPVISTNKAMRELKEQTGERNEYSALQTSWADWCAEHLDSEIVRGTRKEITQRQHMTPETYGAALDKARESLSEAPETLQETILRSDLHHDDTEALRNVLLLKGEISRHKEEGRAYEPPEGALSLDRSSNDRYENGREAFPSLSDRMHLSAVVAHCSAFYAKIEATVKNILRPDTPEIEADRCWPMNAQQEVQRHERNLGLTAPEVISQHDQDSHERHVEDEEPDRDAGPTHSL